MVKDVLLPVGSLVKVTPDHDEQELYMIIGMRIINHESLRAWDYISFPYHEGLTRRIESDRKSSENFFYFNHYEIEEVVSTFSLPESQTGSTIDSE